MPGKIPLTNEQMAAVNKSLSRIKGRKAKKKRSGGLRRKVDITAVRG